MNKVNLLGISGSLRAASLNTQLLNHMARITTDVASWQMGSIGDIPHYNGELDVEAGPAAVQTLKAQIKAADGLVIASPEYNYSFSGVLKNALDWVSRPAYKSVLAGKPIAIAGVTPAPTGTARMQGQLKQVLLGTASLLFPSPELAISGGAGLFDESGVLTDGKTAERTTRFVKTFAEWVDQQTAAHS